MVRLTTWRAALRIARRDARRARGRSLLVALLIGFPVLGAAAVDVLANAAALEASDSVTLELGSTAQARVTMADPNGVVRQTPDGQGGWSGTGGTPADPGPSVEQVEAELRPLLPARDRLVRLDEVPLGKRLRVGDRGVEASLGQLPVDDGVLDGLFRLRSGRLPTRRGEVAVTTPLARSAGIGPGDTVVLLAHSVGGDYPATDRRLSVVGVVSAPGRSAELITRPGDVSPAAASPVVGASWLVVGPEPVTWQQVLALNDHGATVLSRAVVADPPPRDQVPAYSGWRQPATLTATAIGVVGVAVGLVLLQIALMAGPALAVGARRNQRSLALVAGLGGDRRQLRALVLANAAVVGLVGSAVGALLGTGIGATAVIVLRARDLLLAPRLDLHPGQLLGLVATGALTAVAAAVIPAGQAARLDVVAALTGRRGQAPPRLRVPLVGLLAAAVGTAMTIGGAATHRALVAVGGIAVSQLGLVAASGAVVALAARAARGTPPAARLALRDAARQRSRTAPAVAAVMAAIAGSTAALIYVAAQSAYDRRSYSPSTAIGVLSLTVNGAPGQQAPTVDWPRLETVVHAKEPVGSLAPVRTARDSRGGEVSLTAQRPPAEECPPPADGTTYTAAEIRAQRADPRCSGLQARLVSGTFGAMTLVDDGGATAVMTGRDDPAVRAALRAGKVVVPDPLALWPDGTVHLTIAPGPLSDPASGAAPERTVVVPGYAARGPVRPGLPVLPESALAGMGLTAVVEGLVATTTRMPTTAEEQRISAAVSDTAGPQVYMSLERGYVDSYAPGLLALVIAALVVSLAGTFTAVGLAAAEGKADLSTLAAVGASPGLRRRLGAAQAGVISGLGTLLGLGGGILAGYALIRLRQPAAAASPAGSGTMFGLVPGIDNGWQLVMPWPHLAGVALGVPLLAVALGFLTTRSRLQLVRRLGQ